MPASCRLCHREEALDPRLLSCCHAFCSPCLGEWLAGAGHGTAAVILCPLCRSSCPLPDGGVRGLPPAAGRYQSFTEPGEAQEGGLHLRQRAFSSPMCGQTGSPTIHGRMQSEGPPSGHELALLRRSRVSGSFDSNAPSEDDVNDIGMVFDWPNQIRKDVFTVYTETNSALAEVPKPRLLWRAGWQRVSGPYDVKFLPADGGLVVAEAWGRRVTTFSPDGGRLQVLTEHFEPSALAVSPDGSIAVTDTLGGRVVLLSEGRQPEQWVSRGLLAPQGIACKSNGGWAITDAEQHTLGIYSSKGRLLRHIGGYGDAVLNFNEPMYVACDAHDRIIVSDCENHSVKVFDPTGERFLFRIGGCQSDADGLLNFPYGVCVDRRNNILVADYGNARVSAFSPDGKFIRHLLTSDDVIRGPRGLAYEGEGSYSAKVAVTGGWMQKVWVHRVVEF